MDLSSDQVPQVGLTKRPLQVPYRFVQCTGVEKRLIDCAHGEYPTTHEDVRKVENIDMELSDVQKVKKKSNDFL